MKLGNVSTLLLAFAQDHPWPLFRRIRDMFLLSQVSERLEVARAVSDFVSNAGSLIITDQYPGIIDPPNSTPCSRLLVKYPK